jgi:hypothetical protein
MRVRPRRRVAALEYSLCRKYTYCLMKIDYEAVKCRDDHEPRGQYGMIVFARICKKLPTSEQLPSFAGLGAMSYVRREPGEGHEKCIYIKIKIYYICKYIYGVIS